MAATRQATPFPLQTTANCAILILHHCGKEAKGLPETLLAEHFDRCLRIPIRSEARSLNLSNSVAVVTFEALRQQEFPHLQEQGAMTTW